MKARSIRPGLQETRVTEAQIQVVDRFRPSRNLHGLRQGLKFKYVEQQVFNPPDRIDSTPKKSGVVPTIDLNVCDRNQPYMIEYDGYVKVSKSGKYRLTLRSTDAKLFLDQDMVITCQGLAPQEIARDLCLEAGYHSISIVTSILLQPSHIIEVFWEGPGIEKQIIPSQVFFHD